MVSKKKAENSITVYKQSRQQSCPEQRKNIHEKKVTFIGPIMRSKDLEHLTKTGNFEGKRNRGRQREKIMDNVTI